MQRQAVMSCHSYVTTTVEYYEYITPHTPCYNYESIFRPYPVAISNPYIESPHSYADYAYDLPLSSDFAGLCLLGRQGCQHIFNMPEYEEEPAMYAYRRQQLEEPQRNHYEPEPEQEEVNQPEDLNKDSDKLKAENLKNSESTDRKPKEKKKNVYQAEQGYIVEEPASEDGQE